MLPSTQGFLTPVSSARLAQEWKVNRPKALLMFGIHGRDGKRSLAVVYSTVVFQVAFELKLCFTIYFQNHYHHITPQPTIAPLQSHVQVSDITPRLALSWGSREHLWVHDHCRIQRCPCTTKHQAGKGYYLAPDVGGSP